MALPPVARSLTELIALRAKTQPDDPAVHTGAAEFGEQLKTLSYSDIAKSVDRLCAHYASLSLPHPCPADQIPPEQTISILTSTAIDESLLEIALAKLGLASLLLSTNNSPAAVVHLCRLTKSSHLIYGTKYAAVAQEVQDTLKKEGYDLAIVRERRFPLWGEGGVRESEIDAYPARLAPEQEAPRTCVILHSSGSTGFPKPVYITHRAMMANISSSLVVPGFSALPLFHGFGHYSIFRCIYVGRAFTLMPPNLPLTSANICRIIRNSPTRPVQHFAVPYVLKLLGETEEGMRTLASFEAVPFSGAAMPDELGDRLVAAGVPLISIYGTTETGAIFHSRRDYKTDKGWNWLRAEGPIVPYLEFAPQGSSTFELIVKDGWPAKIMSNREDGAYATKDLMLRHPEHGDWYKYIGRMDDTLTQTLGEKTNPVPIELAIRGNSPLIAECIVFGDGRPQIGALILPSDQGEELSKDTKRFVEAVWPVIAEANGNAPTHSRILPEMVEVLPYGTDIPVATKMSILRPACYRLFAPLIDSIYDRFERGTGQPKRLITSQPEMQAFLTETITVALGDKASQGLLPSTDLFAYGVDSLQATRVRNVIGKSLELGDAPLGQNIVYEHPSIERLAEYLLALRSGELGALSAVKTHEKMWTMVDKWSDKLGSVGTAGSATENTQNGHDGEIVVLTGATGSLGAHILYQLVNRSAISRVICLSRAGTDHESLERINASLASRLLTLAPSTSSKITSFASDITLPHLGLTPEQLSMIRQSTAIIHNAWPVNFVLSLESFEPHIGGAVNLLNLALAGPRKVKPAFFFSSSVATRQGRKEDEVDEGFSDDPVTAGGMGYGQSKWVVEKVCERAGAKARVGVLRIGQLVGDTINGVWNETEAWPLMFKAANSIGALPRLNQKLPWLPVDQAAQTISEIVLSTLSSPSMSTPRAEVYHVLNPRLTDWSHVLTGLKDGGLGYAVEDRKIWLEKLEKSERDVAKNPTYKLLDYYRARLGGEDEPRPINFSVRKTEGVSETLRACGAVDRGMVALWVRRWKETAFLV